MRKRLKRRVRINAKGKRLYKFINMVHSGGVACFGQYCRGEVFYADIYYSDLKKLRQMAKDCGVELEAAEYDTLLARLFRYRRRLGLLLGVIIAAAGALYFSRVVVSIDIEGNTIVSDEVILSALAELDIKPGTPIHRINFHACEDKLRIMVDDIAWAGIRHTGSRIAVQVTEITPVPDMVHERVPCNIVASRDAEIVYTVVRDGMLMHKVGDFVPRGTLLISGVAADDTGHVTIHHAMGDIRGVYEDTVTFSAAFASESFIPTGNTSRERYLRLFSLKIPLFFGRNNYEYSSTERSEKPLRVFGKELPIGIIREDIAETALSETVFTDDELKERLMERVYLYEKNFLSEDTEIIERTITPESSGDSLTLNVTYRLESNICEQREIFIK